MSCHGDLTHFVANNLQLKIRLSGAPQPPPLPLRGPQFSAPHYLAILPSTPTCCGPGAAESGAGRQGGTACFAGWEVRCRS